MLRDPSDRPRCKNRNKCRANRQRFGRGYPVVLILRTEVTEEIIINQTGKTIFIKTDFMHKIPQQDMFVIVLSVYTSVMPAEDGVKGAFSRDPYNVQQADSQ